MRISFIQTIFNFLGQYIINLKNIISRVIEVFGSEIIQKAEYLSLPKQVFNLIIKVVTIFKQYS
ncbi:hypothetical protein DOM24_01455 [Acinetobacter radioresistens]|nr:hypothetical protein DOM24_01455 [Acinetobacter radioresistens]HAK32600.1 hypothetical protein [Acinetobacter radioresistens]